MEKEILLSPRAVLKVLILGDHSTGKTSLLYKYMNNIAVINNLDTIIILPNKINSKFLIHPADPESDLFRPICHY